MKFFEKLNGFRMEPEKTFSAIKEESLGDALKYYAVFAGLYSLIVTALFAIVGGERLFPADGFVAAMVFA